MLLAVLVVLVVVLRLVVDWSTGRSIDQLIQSLQTIRPNGCMNLQIYA
jgi:hypothetical protein